MLPSGTDIVDDNEEWNILFEGRVELWSAIGLFLKSTHKKRTHTVLPRGGSLLWNPHIWRLHPFRDTLSHVRRSIFMGCAVWSDSMLKEFST